MSVKPVCLAICSERLKARVKTENLKSASCSRVTLKISIKVVNKILKQYINSKEKFVRERGRQKIKAVPNQGTTLLVVVPPEFSRGICIYPQPSATCNGVIRKRLLFLILCELFAFRAHGCISSAGVFEQIPPYTALSVKSLRSTSPVHSLYQYSSDLLPLSEGRWRDYPLFITLYIYFAKIATVLFVEDISKIYLSLIQSLLSLR